MSRIEILNTPSGKILQALINDGITVGISSRGLGSVKRKNGSDVVQEDLMLTAWDFVSDPSTHRAFQQAVNEGKSMSGFTRVKNWDGVNSIIIDILDEWK